MKEEVTKKTGVILLLISIVVAITFTFVILSYTQAPKVVEGPREYASSGEITLTVERPPIVKDEGKGSVSLTLLPPE
tara:strand:+ start:31332 stop:31562 length:231 start_codon:yes stop_codon:yes gene_type:complete